MKVRDSKIMKYIDDVIRDVENNKVENVVSADRKQSSENSSQLRLYGISDQESDDAFSKGSAGAISESDSSSDRSSASSIPDSDSSRDSSMSSSRRSRQASKSKYSGKKSRIGPIASNRKRARSSGSDMDKAKVST
jgi:hypothetical protein